MNKNRGFYISLSLMVPIITYKILEYLGVSSITDILAIIVLAGSSVAYTIFVNSKNAFGRKINIFSSAIMLMAGFGISISTTLINSFPHFSSEHTIVVLIIGGLGVIGVIAAIIFWIWNFNKYSK